MPFERGSIGEKQGKNPRRFFTKSQATHRFL